MPYFRAAYEWNWNQQSAHVGALYMQSNVNPAVADFQTEVRWPRSLRDYGFDAGYQFLGDAHRHHRRHLHPREPEPRRHGLAFNLANGTAFSPKRTSNRAGSPPPTGISTHTV